jgi:phage replication-related protein YjqB (UPF0714/DUF867 family)
MAEINLTLSADAGIVLRDVAQRTTGVFGVKGAGKTVTLCVIAEELARQDVRYIFFDPIGALKQKEKDGERVSPVKEAYLNEELTEENGANVAEAFLDERLTKNNVSFVLDLSHMSQAEKVSFSDAFCEQLLKLKDGKDDPIIVIADEVHEIAPEKVGKGEKLSGGEWVRLCTLGRNKGFGIILASQRLTRVSANVRDLIDVYLFHQLIGSTTMRHVEDLLEYQVEDKKQLKAVVARVQGLRRGEVYLFDPSNSVEDGGRAKQAQGHIDAPEGSELESGQTGHDGRIEVEQENAEVPVAEEAAVETSGKADTRDVWTAAYEGANEQGLPEEECRRIADEAQAAADGEYAIEAETPKGEAKAEVSKERGVGDSPNPRFVQKVIASEPAAAQTHSTKHGKPGDEVYVDDDYPAHQLHEVAVHERTEEMAIRAGLSQPEAHEVANQAERALSGERKFRESQVVAERVARKARKEVGVPMHGKAVECPACDDVLPNVPRFDDHWLREHELTNWSSHGGKDDEEDVALMHGPRTYRMGGKAVIDRTRAALMPLAGKAYHTVFPDIEPEVVEIVRGLMAQKPRSRSRSIEQKTLLAQAFVRELEMFYDMRPIDVAIVTPEQASVNGHYNPARREIRLPVLNKPGVEGSWSVVTLLHEFRHAMQGDGLAQIRRGEGPDPAPSGNQAVDEREEDARAWSLSLYALAAPDAFKRGVKRGIIFFITHEDIGESKEYDAFAKLAEDAQEGTDYRVTFEDRPGRFLLLAPHGGTIEPMSDVLTRQAAGESIAYYTFESLTEAMDLHITSHKFDEPRSIDLLRRHGTVVALHGMKDRNPGEEIVYTGGRDAETAARIEDALQAAGFNCVPSLDENAGASPKNICNKGTTGAGVQLEISRSLRDRLKADDDLRARFCGAIHQCLMENGQGNAPPPPPPPADVRAQRRQPPRPGLGYRPHGKADGVMARLYDLAGKTLPPSTGKAGKTTVEALRMRGRAGAAFDVNDFR